MNRMRTRSAAAVLAGGSTSALAAVGMIAGLLIGAVPAQAASAPNPVQSVSVDAGDGMATVSWTMPANGTPRLTGFIVYKAYIPRGLTLDRYTGFPIVVCETDMIRRACDVSGLINQSPLRLRGRGGE